MGVQKKILKRGSKAEPLCTHCGQRGHNAASCEGLGQQLLLLLRKKHSAPQLQEFLRGAHAAELVGCKRKPLKTLKRAKGNRHFKARQASQAGASKKSKRGRTSKQKQKSRDSQRKPRSRKMTQGHCLVNRDSVQKAHSFLKKTKWCWHETHCQCGGLLELQNFKHCESRGHGRRFKRCVECRSYFDILSWSHLPIVRLPLPYLVEAMKRYFSGSAPPSSDEVGRQLGINGRNGSALQKLFNTLSTHEATLALESQNETTLTGLPLTSTIGLGLKTHVFSLN